MSPNWCPYIEVLQKVLTQMGKSSKYIRQLRLLMSLNWNRGNITGKLKSSLLLPYSFSFQLFQSYRFDFNTPGGKTIEPVNFTSVPAHLWLKLFWFSSSSHQSETPNLELVRNYSSWKIYLKMRSPYDEDITRGDKAHQEGTSGYFFLVLCHSPANVCVPSSANHTTACLI